MSALKSVIITLPPPSSKGLAGTKSNNNNSSTEQQLTSKSAPKLNFTTSILVDKIKVEQPQTKVQSVKHLDLGQMPLVDGLPIVLKQETDADSPMRGKKRRLDHLTWEEKLQRKKLKNRVAAQTSRDRKKAKLDDLEEAVRLLKESNDRLTKECAMLRTSNQSLVTETQRLKRDNEMLMAKSISSSSSSKSSESKDEACEMCQARQARVDCTVPALGSAVSPIDPLQQGGPVQTARPLTTQHSPSAPILLKILTLFLLSKTYLASSKGTTTSSASRSSPRAFCERLPPKWRQILLSQMNRLPAKKRVMKNLTLEKKWWGRHQVMWKPMQPMEA